MSDTLEFVVLFSGIWCLVGIIFLAVGIGLSRAWRRKDERMRDSADGVVLEVNRHTTGSGSNRSTSWRPLVEFEYEGRRISLEGDTVSHKKYYEGQPVRVRYDPQDPACFAIEGSAPERLLGRVFTAVGAACVAVGVLVAAALLWSDPLIAMRRHMLERRWGLR